MAKPLTERLGLKAGVSGAALNVPADLAGVFDLPAALPESGEGVDFLICFVADAAAVAANAATVMAAYTAGGHLWLAYPKKSGAIKTDITRDHGWRPLKDADFHPVTQISIDETWSALRYRHRSEIKTMTRNAAML